jgi:RNA polymerase sigma-70 factor (ECF subfamily)
MHHSNPAPEENGSTSTSRSLLARLWANDSDAWERVVALYAPLVWHWCRRLNLPEQDMADIFQEVFQSVAVHIHTFRKDRPGDTFRGWLRAITRNKVYDYFRLRRQEPQAVGGTAQYWLGQLPEAIMGDDEPATNPEYQLLFRRALDLIQSQFEERTWQAFWRVVVDGRTSREVAEELKMTQGAVRVAKCRVLHRLRQELGDLGF